MAVQGGTGHPVELAPLAGQLQEVRLSDSLERIVETAYTGLQQVAGQHDALDPERKALLQQQLNSTRQRLIRFLIALQWSTKARAVQAVNKVLSSTSLHAASLRDAADHLAYLHAELALAPAAHFDVATAMHVLQTGSYGLLPESIRDLAPEQQQDAGHSSRAAARLSHRIHCKLLQEKVPAGAQVVKVEEGCLHIMSDNKYTAILTLGQPPNLEEPLRLLEKAAEEAEQEAAAAAARGPDGVPGQGPTSGPPASQPCTTVEQPLLDAAGADAVSAGQPDVQEAHAAEAVAALTARLQSGGEASTSGRDGQTVGQPAAWTGWRWQLLHVTLLPALMLVVAAEQRLLAQKTRALLAAGCSGMAPATDQQLQWLVDRCNLRMSASADAALFRPVLSRIDSARAAVQLQEGPQPGSGGPGEPNGALSGPGVEAALSSKTFVSQGAVNSDEVDARSSAGPLVLLHDMLCCTATRVALMRAYTAAKQLAEGSWMGKLKVGESNAKSTFRLTMWLNAPSLCAKVSAPHIPPAVDVGRDQSGHALTCTHAPPLLPVRVRPLTPNGSYEEATPLLINVPAGDVDVEAMLVQAARQHAKVQLDLLCELVSRATDLQSLRAHCRVVDVLDSDSVSNSKDDVGNVGGPALVVSVPNTEAAASGTMDAATETEVLQVALELKTGALRLSVGAQLQSLVVPAQLRALEERFDKTRCETALAAPGGGALPDITRAHLLSSSVKQLVLDLKTRLDVTIMRRHLEQYNLQHTIIPRAVWETFYYTPGSPANRFSMSRMLLMALPDLQAPWGFSHVAATVPQTAPGKAAVPRAATPGNPPSMPPETPPAGVGTPGLRMGPSAGPEPSTGAAGAPEGPVTVPNVLPGRSGTWSGLLQHCLLFDYARHTAKKPAVPGAAASVLPSTAAAEEGADSGAQSMLVSLACDSQGVPLRVVSVRPVPPSVTPQDGPFQETPRKRRLPAAVEHVDPITNPESHPPAKRQQVGNMPPADVAEGGEGVDVYGRLLQWCYSAATISQLQQQLRACGLQFQQQVLLPAQLGMPSPNTAGSGEEPHQPVGAPLQPPATPQPPLHGTAQAAGEGDVQGRAGPLRRFQLTQYGGQRGLLHPMAVHLDALQSPAGCFELCITSAAFAHNPAPPHEGADGGQGLGAGQTDGRDVCDPAGTQQQQQLANGHAAAHGGQTDASAAEASSTLQPLRVMHWASCESKAVEGQPNGSSACVSQSTLHGKAALRASGSGAAGHQDAGPALDCPSWLSMWQNVGQLRVRYNMKQGHSVLSALQVVHEQYRLQLFASRLHAIEAISRPKQKRAAAAEVAGARVEAGHAGQALAAAPKAFGGADAAPGSSAGDGNMVTANGLHETKTEVVEGKGVISGKGSAGKATQHGLPNGIIHHVSANGAAVQTPSTDTCSPEPAAPQTATAPAAPANAASQVHALPTQVRGPPWLLPRFSQLSARTWSHPSCGTVCVSHLGPWDIILSVAPALHTGEARREDAAAPTQAAQDAVHVQFTWRHPTAAQGRQADNTQQQVALMDLPAQLLQQARVRCIARQVWRSDGAAAAICPDTAALAPGAGDEGNRLCSSTGLEQQQCSSSQHGGAWTAVCPMVRQSGAAAGSGVLPPFQVDQWARLAEAFRERMLLDALAITALPRAMVAAAVAAAQAPGSGALVEGSVQWVDTKGLFESAFQVMRASGVVQVSLRFFAAGLVWLQAQPTDPLQTVPQQPPAPAFPSFPSAASWCTSLVDSLHKQLDAAPTQQSSGNVPPAGVWLPVNKVPQAVHIVLQATLAL